ncbi:MAG: fibronectin type III domain-containing protein [Gallionella sp.]
MNHSISCKLTRQLNQSPERIFSFPTATSSIHPHSNLAAFVITLLASTLSIPLSHAAGNAETGKAAWFRTCERCHGNPTPRSNNAFSDYGTTANKLSVYANDPTAITKAANEGYIVPEGNTNDKVPVGHNTKEEMGAFAGMAPDRLGYGTTPTQYAIDISAYFASLLEVPATPKTTAANPTPQVVAIAALPTEQVSPAISPKVIEPATPVASIAVSVAKAPASAHTTQPNFDLNGPVILRARAGDQQAKVYFNVPAALASTITDFTVIASTKGVATSISARGAKSPITVNGLSNGTDYTFTVVANSNDGKSLRSAPSDQITPLAILGD